MAKTAARYLHEFAAKIKGVSTDHAEDQKKLTRLICEWKVICDRELRGEKALLSSPIGRYFPILCEETLRKVANVGGQNAWEMLPEDQKNALDQETYQVICTRIGNEEFSGLSEASAKPNSGP
jgi:hypothetical protein